MSRAEEVRILPVLCGSLHTPESDPPTLDPLVEEFAQQLKELARQRRAVFIAGADLAHLGPAFGTPPLTPEDHQRLERVDAQTISQIAQGDAEGFLNDVMADFNARHICGLSAIYTVDRGVYKKVSPPFLRPTDICVACGCCVSICPTDAMKAIFDSVRGEPSTQLTQLAV